MEGEGKMLSGLRSSSSMTGRRKKPQTVDTELSATTVATRSQRELGQKPVLVARDRNKKEVRSPPRRETISEGEATC